MNIILHISKVLNFKKSATFAFVMVCCVTSALSAQSNNSVATLHCPPGMQCPPNLVVSSYCPPNL